MKSIKKTIKVQTNKYVKNKHLKILVQIQVLLSLKTGQRFPFVIALYLSQCGRRYVGHRSESVRPDLCYRYVAIGHDREALALFDDHCQLVVVFEL